jgi:hypothetical protein
VGSRTRRRPIRRVYAAAKDAEGGKIERFTRCFVVGWALPTKIDRSTQKLTAGRIPYFDTCPPEEDSIFDIYPPPEDSLFQSFFFD